ncbi:translation initiation factor IF-2-like [Pollicipes pollicipes]|uniref:translation initiation factor IF-2-like n=1 Tax=Pollicipes pollicipes TaxID=41117 RepID=UPI0018849663|nr:translation initiation factor IF-2-like [Pollicipes pollicipes]
MPDPLALPEVDIVVEPLPRPARAEPAPAADDGDDEVRLLPTPEPRPPLDVILLDNSDISDDEIVLGMGSPQPPRPAGVGRPPPPGATSAVGLLRQQRRRPSDSGATSASAVDKPRQRRQPSASGATSTSFADKPRQQRRPSASGATSALVAGAPGQPRRRPSASDATSALVADAPGQPGRRPSASDAPVDRQRLPSRRRQCPAQRTSSEPTPSRPTLPPLPPGALLVSRVGPAAARATVTASASCGPELRQAKLALEEVLFGRLENATPIRRRTAAVLKQAQAEVSSQRSQHASLKVRLWQASQRQRHLLHKLNLLLAGIPLEKRIEKIAEIEDLLSFLQVRVMGNELEPQMLLEKKSGQQPSQFRVIAPESGAPTHPAATDELSEI